jgi:putative transcriptional regulator
MSLKEFWEKRFGPRGPRLECHLRELREAAGFTPEEIAEHCKVSVETITLIEDARYEPSVVLAEHIASYLNTNVESLFTAHSPFAPFSAGFEERLRSQNWRVGSWCFFILLAISLFGANILLQFTNEQGAGLALGALWALGSIAYLIGATRISGNWRFLRQRNRATSSRRTVWYRVLAGAIFFATLMVLTTDTHDSWQRRILRFLFLAITYGGAMYWMSYRKSKSK